MGNSCCKRKPIRTPPCSYQSEASDVRFGGVLNVESDLGDHSENNNTKPSFTENFYTLCSKSDFISAHNVLDSYSVDINQRDRFGHTPLERAAMDGRLDIVHFLVRTGARVNNRTNCKEQSPLLVATLCKRPEICKYLVSAGAEVNGCDNASGSPLFWAVRKGCKDTALALIESGADVNVKACRQKIPFHAATVKDDVEMMHLLFTHGADPEAKGLQDCTPLHLCSELGFYAAVRFLVVGICVSMDTVNSRKESAFHVAMMNRQRYVLDLLIMAGYDIRREECIYERPSHWILGVEEEQKLTQRFARIARNPRALRDLCIFRIRRLLGRWLPSVVERLPVSTKVNSLLKLTHVPHFMNRSRTKIQVRTRSRVQTCRNGQPGYRYPNSPFRRRCLVLAKI